MTLFDEAVKDAQLDIASGLVALSRRLLDLADWLHHRATAMNSRMGAHIAKGVAMPRLHFALKLAQLQLTTYLSGRLVALSGRLSPCIEALLRAVTAPSHD